MRDRSGKLIEKARTAVPEGTFAVGAGLVVAAITAYVFVIVANKGLSEAQYSAFGAFWALHLRGRARASSSRSSRRSGGRSPTGARRASAAARSSRRRRASARSSPRRWWSSSLATVAALRRRPVPRQLAARRQPRRSASSASTACTPTRGTLSGNARFRPYGEMLATDGVVRLAGALVLLAIGVDNAGAYGMCMALSPFVAVAVSLRKRDKLLEPGPAGALLRAVERARLAARRLGAHAAARLLVAARRQPAEGPGRQRQGGRRVHVRVLRRPDPTTAVPSGAGHAAARSSRTSPARAATTTSGTGLKQLLVIVVGHRRGRHRRRVHDRRARRRDPLPAVQHRQPRPRAPRRRRAACSSSP